MKYLISFLISTLFAFSTLFAQSELINPPTGMMVEDLDVTQATLRWDAEENAAAWIVSYKVFQQTEYIDISTEQPVVYLQNLMSGTRYLWTVRAIDINGDTTQPCEVQSFVTLGFDSDCPQVENLSIGSSSSNGITVQWTADFDATSWEVVRGEIGSSPDFDGYRVQTQNYEATLSNLTAFERYQFAVRSNCDSYVSDWKYIYTNFLPSSVQELPIQFDFENEEDNKNVGFVNSMANAWEIGSATNASSIGNKALYISDNNGQTNACNNTTSAISYAYIDFNIPNYAVGFYIDFKYKTQTVLQNASLKVFLVSPGSAINISQAPYEGEQVGAPAYLGSENSWENVHIELPPHHIGTTTRILFVWQNSSDCPNTSAVAIDDIYITARYCATPSNLRAENITSSSAFLAWDVNDNQSSFNLEYKETSEDAWTRIDGITPNNILDNLQPATSYTFRVQADCLDEQSFWSDTATFTTHVLIDAPTDLNVTTFDENSANIVWATNIDAQSWLVETTNTSTLSVSQNEVSQNSILLDNLSENTLYQIKVRAVSTYNDTSLYSSPIYVHTLCSPIEQFPYHADDTIKLATEGGFCFEQDCWRVEANTLLSPMFKLSESANPVLSFNASLSDGTFPQLFIQEQNGQLIPLQNITLGHNSILLNEYSDFERATFIFQIQESDDRDYDFQITDFTIKDTCLAPDNLSISHITANSAVLEWSNYANNTSVNIRIIDTENNDTVAVNGVSSPFDLENLLPNTQYIIWLGAFCNNDSAANMSIINFTTEDITSACPTPTNFLCEHYQSKGDETIICTWDDVEDNPYIQWEVNYKEALAVNFSSATVSHYPRFTLRNLERGSRWEFKVRAICSVGNISDWTEIQSVLVGEQGIEAINGGVIELKVYPNPADKIIRIESNASELKEAQLIDANGRVLKAWDNLPNEIDISQYPTGTYFLNVSVNGTRISRKVNFN